MDKSLLKAYIRVLVEEEVKRVLPPMLEEIISENKTLRENTSSTEKKSKFSRTQLAEMLGLERLGEDTIVAKTNKIMEAPPGIAEDNPALKAINRNYSDVMKKMGM